MALTPSWNRREGREEVLGAAAAPAVADPVACAFEAAPEADFLAPFAEEAGSEAESVDGGVLEPSAAFVTEMGDARGVAESDDDLQGCELADRLRRLFDLTLMLLLVVFAV